MPERVLVIEDEALVRDLVALNLAHAGLEVACAADYQSGLDALLAPGVDLAIVDLMLPGGEGFSLVRQARDEGVRCPILMLTARSDVSSRVRGLDCGADDYLTKPFDVAELMARVRSLVRRTSGRVAAVPRLLELGRFHLRFDTGRALTREGELTLSELQLSVLGLFSRHEGTVLSRADLLEEVWGPGAFPTDRTVEDVLQRLRELFEEDLAHPAHFLTVRGRGYVFHRGAGA